MRILVTGAAGQVGSHIVDALLASHSHSVLGIDNFATGRRVHLPVNDNFELVEGSIADKALVETIFERFKPEVVVHAAASYKDPGDWYEDLETNGVGGLNLVWASKEHNARRFIYFQTALVYGVNPLTNPITLDHPKRVDNSSYAITKGISEDFLTLSGLDYVTFRLANVIGDRCVSGPLPIFYQRLVEGKKCFVTPARRDFVYVGDLVKTVLKAIDGHGQGTYHFSTGKDFAIRELFETVAAKLGLDRNIDVEERPIGEDEAPSILIDPTRTLEDFSIEGFTSLSEIVERAVAYYREFGTAGEFTHLKAER